MTKRRRPSKRQLDVATIVANYQAELTAAPHVQEHAPARGEASCLASALAYAARGWSVFPVPPGTRQSYKSMKVHAGARWGATKDPDEIKRDFGRWPNAGIGLPCGPGNGFWVLDVDTKEGGHDHDGIAALTALTGWFGPLPSTLTAVSPSRSRHYYFRWPEGRAVGNSTSQIGPGIDVRGEGGMVIAPPSKRSDGTYAWVCEEEIAEAPAWLITLVSTCGAGDGQTEPKSREELEAPLELIEAALKVIPVPAENDYNRWIEVGMATRGASGGSLEGLVLFDRWTQDSKLYDRDGLIKKWLTFKPDRIGFGSLHRWASAADPTWLERYDAQVEAEIKRANREAIGEQTTTAPGGNGSTGNKPQANEKAQTKGEPTTTPVDLWVQFEPPPLPTNLLPKTIAEFAVEQGELMGADSAGLAMGALTTCGAAIPDEIKLRVKLYGGWLEAARLWAAYVGLVSTKKTPILRAVIWPLVAIERELQMSYAAAKQHWDLLPKEEQKTTPEPKRLRVLIADTSVEAVQEVLRDNTNGLFAQHDELAGWLGSMDKYNSQRGGAYDRAFWLQAYNGGGCPVDRIKRGSFWIENLSVALLGDVQPEAMRKICADTIDDGLIQRLIPIMLRPATLSRDAEVPTATLRYNELVRNLYDLIPPINPVVFSTGAQAIRAALEAKHLAWTAFETVNKKLTAHLGKYDGLFARLCLLWHCIESTERGTKEPSMEIDAGVAQRVADFLHGFLLPHAKAFYTEIFGLADEHDRLKAVAGYILAHKLEGLTNRDIQRGDRTMRGLKKQDIDGIFQQLDALGWIDRVASLNPHKAPRWVVNPQVHQHFAERAAQERKRRQHDRETIHTFTTAAKQGEE
jgi:hypothetical protein